MTLGITTLSITVSNYMAPSIMALSKMVVLLCWVSFTLIVVYAEFHKLSLYVECGFAECHYAECRYAECHYAHCRYAECHYAEYRGVKLYVCNYQMIIISYSVSSRPFQLGLMFVDKDSCPTLDCISMAWYVTISISNTQKKLHSA